MFGAGRYPSHLTPNLRHRWHEGRSSPHFTRRALVLLSKSYMKHRGVTPFTYLQVRHPVLVFGLDFLARKGIWAVVDTSFGIEFRYSFAHRSRTEMEMLSSGLTWGNVSRAKLSD